MTVVRISRDLWEAGRHKARADRAQEVVSRSSGRNPKGTPSGATGSKSAGGGSTKQVVLKVIHWAKSKGAAGRTAYYIARERATDKAQERSPVELETETGETLMGRDAIDRHMKTWDLVSNDQNRSKAWYRSNDDERAKMDATEALAKRQSVHLILSVPQGIGSPEALRAAAREVLSDHLRAADHKYVYAVHTDHGRPHVHVVAKVKSELDGRQLRLGPQELEVMRRDFAAAARRHGMDVEASRRLERPDLAADIVAGRAPLRENWTKQKYEPNPAGPTRRNLEAPAFLASEGKKIAQRRAGKEPAPGLIDRMKEPFKRYPRLEPEPGKERMQDPAIARFRAQLDGYYTHPKAAEASYIRMAKETGTKKAVWTLNNRPEFFGASKPGGAKPHHTGRGLPKLDQPDRAQPGRKLDQPDRAQPGRKLDQPDRAISRLARELDGPGIGRAAADAIRQTGRQAPKTERREPRSPRPDIPRPRRPGQDIDL